MKKRNGFTLIELLAVIVVLAIIMVIAIPSVLDVMQNSKKKLFNDYIIKIVDAVQLQYTVDSSSGKATGMGMYVYDIKQDINLNGTGEYEGYVVVNALNMDNIQYIVTLYDTSYEIVGRNITTDKFPSLDDVRSLSTPKAVNNAYEACVEAYQKTGLTGTCKNKSGAIITADAS